MTGLPSRRQGLLAFDSVRGTLLLFGGHPRNDTWELHDPAFGHYGTFGTGCGGTAGVPALAAAPGSLPRLANTFQAQITGLPQRQPAIVHVAFSRTSLGGVALPLALGGIGMPGCRLYTSGDLAQPLNVVGGTASWSLPLGNYPQLVGFTFYNQVFALDAGANALGVVGSNAAAGVIGR